MQYRNLTDEEVSCLINNGCSAENWSDVLVANGFSPETIVRVNFYGVVRLGLFSEKVPLPGGLAVPSGIYDTTLFNVTVGDNSLIANVHGYIANYDIGSRTYIADVGKIYMEGVSSFGNGLKINVLNETGGREVTIYDGMSAQVAYISAMYRHRPAIHDRLDQMASALASSRLSDRGRIGSNVKIENVGMIRNVTVGDSAILQGCLRLFDGTVGSSAEAPVLVGSGTVCTDFIVQSGSVIEDNAVITRTFVGQGVILAKGFTSVDSLFFANSHCENGEAVSVFAGPYTVSHHKSTLLIGSILSFANAGSATNFSNHLYKLGPIHQGVFGRGVKFGSGSYMMLPVHVAPFTTVLGHHSGRIDTSGMPFSYLLESGGVSYLVPGANLRNCGFFRDVRKWPARDRRAVSDRQDCITFNALSPYTALGMMKGKTLLTNMLSEDRFAGVPASYGGCSIMSNSITKGLERYEAALKFYMGGVIADRLEGIRIDSDERLRSALEPEYSVGSGDWADIAGLLAPKAEIGTILDGIEDGSITALSVIGDRFNRIAANYRLYEWCWVYCNIKSVFGVMPQKITRRSLTDIMRQWDSAAEFLHTDMENDAAKEFGPDAKVGFGVDGTDAEADFKTVRGEYGNNGLVQAVKEARQKVADTASRIISSL